MSRVQIQRAGASPERQDKRDEIDKRLSRAATATAAHSFGGPSFHAFQSPTIASVNFDPTL